MTHLLLVRHGETDFNRKKIIQGQRNVPLNEQGRQEAMAVAQYLARTEISALISSDLARAWKTAVIIGNTCGIVPTADKRLRELGFGKMEGQPWTEILQQFPATAGLWESPDVAPVPGGEPPASMVRRVGEFLAGLPRKRQGSVVIVAHGGPIRTLLHLLTAMPLPEAQQIKLENTGITSIRMDGQNVDVEYINALPHLARSDSGFSQNPLF